MRRIAPLVLLLAAACSGGSDSTPVTPPPTPTIAVSLAPASGTVARGATTTTTVSLTRGGNYAGAVALGAEGTPAGVTVTFAPSSLTGSITSATATIAVGATAAPGTPTFTITASGSGVNTVSAPYALTIPTPAIGLSAASAALSVTQGTSGNVGLTITRSNGFADAVSLSTSALPTGVTATFAPASVAAGASSSTLALSVGASTAAGTYPITITASGTGVASVTTTVTLTVVAAATPAFSLSAAPAALSLTAGQSGTSTVTAIRTGGFAGALTVAVSGAPAGMTATLSPTSIAANGTTSTLTVATTAAVTPGTYTLTVSGSGTGVTTQSTTVAVTVAAPAGYSLTASTTSLTQGGTGTSTVTVTRTGGFTGTVNLAVSGLPTGVTASINPAAVTGTSATITFTATVGATTGAFNATVTGTATGLANVTTTVAGTVSPGGGGGGTGNVNWRFCDPADLPLFFAFRAGTSGAWTRVLPTANNTYAFTLNGPGSVVIVRPQTGGVATTVQYNFTSAEMAGTAEFECAQNPASKTLTGTVTGLSGTQTAQISVGGGTATVTSPATAYTITDVSTGTTDLLAFRSQQTVGSNFIPTIVPDRAILRRNVDYAAGSAIPVLDFNGADAFTPASATYTLAGASGGEITQILSLFNTSNGTSSGFLFGPLLNTTGSATVFGVPSSRLVSGDFHFAIGFSLAQDGSTQRGVYQYNRELTNRTLTLGPQLSTPTVSVVGTAPYARLRSAGTWQTDYSDGIGVTFTQGTTATNSRSWTISQSRGFAAGASYQLEIPDLSGTSGWNSTWGLTTGLETTVSTSANGGAVLAFINPAEGAAFRQASRTTQITP